MDIKTAEEIVRTACVKANPSIIELSFGCEFTSQEMKCDLIYLGQTNVGGTLAYIPSVVDTIHEDFNFNEGDDVIGHAIQLHDVLHAIKGLCSVNLYFDGNKNESILALWTSQPDTRAVWSLSLPFKEQADETKLFLAELLK